MPHNPTQAITLWGTLTAETHDTLIVQYQDGGARDEVHLRDVVVVLPPSTGNIGLGCGLVYMKCTKVKDAEIEYKIHQVQIKELPEQLLKEYLLSSRPSHLSVPKSSSGEANFHVIVSVRSGTCEAGRFYNDVVRPCFDMLGLLENDYSVHHTTTERSIIDFANNVLSPRANAGIAQTVLLVSGDGGIVDIANVLLQSTQSSTFRKPCIGLIALGTGNALANSTGLNQDSTRGLKDFFRGHPHSVPTLTARFSNNSKILLNEGRQTESLPIDHAGVGIVHGAVVCSWGLHASLVADSDTTEYRKYGTQRFQMAAKELLDPSDGSEPHRYRGRIAIIQKDANGEESTMYVDRREHMYILATLVSNLEQKLTISPNSKPLDGQLRFVHFGVLPSDEIMRILGLAFAGGKHIEENAVDYDAIQGLRIEFEEPDGRWRRICVDGKIIQVGEGGWVEVRRETRDVLDLIANVPGHTSILEAKVVER